MARQHPRTGDVRIGVSGWRYAGWRGQFYPKGLPQKKELSYAASIFNSIEINGTHYSLQRPEYFAHWASETPDDFVFSVKAPRFMTHMLKLKRIETPLANFMANGLLELGPKLGPILWQVPERLVFDSDRFESFFTLLPRDTDTARKVARGHDHRVTGRVSFKRFPNQPLRHAMEIRSKTFAVPKFIQLLRRHRIGLVVADTVDWPLLMDVTADFIYVRLHGSVELYHSGYDDNALDAWARRVAAWARGGEPADAVRVIARRAPKCTPRDVYVYFDNDAKVRAPFDAQGLKERVDARLKAWRSRSSRRPSRARSA